MHYPAPKKAADWGGNLLADTPSSLLSAPSTILSSSAKRRGEDSGWEKLLNGV